MNLTKIEEIRALKQNVHATFESPQGKETMKFIEKIGSWFPNMNDSGDTNEIIARDANRRLIGTLKSIMELSAEQIFQMTKED